MKQRTRMLIAGAVLIVTAGGSTSAQAIVTRAAATPSSTGSSATPRGPCPLPVFGPGASYHPTIHPADFSPRVTNPYFPLPRAGPTSTPGQRTARPRSTSSHRQSTPRSSTASARVRSTTGCISTGYWNSARPTTTPKTAAATCGYFGERHRHPGHERAPWSRPRVIPGRRGWCAAGGLHAGTPAARPAVPPGMVARKCRGPIQRPSKDASVTVPYGAFLHTLRTQETTALEPAVVDNKYYVRGLGQVEEVAVKGPLERLVLVASSTEPAFARTRAITPAILSTEG